MAANAVMSGEKGFGLGKFVKQSKGQTEMKSVLDQYKSGSTGKVRTTLGARKSNPPPNSESGPSRR